MAFYTENRENDERLAAINVVPPVTFIGGILYPPTPSIETSGDETWMIIGSDGDVQTTRSDGQAPSREQALLGSGSYTTSEYIKTAFVTQKDGRRLGNNIDKIDEYGTRKAMRTVGKAVENAQLTKFVTSASGMHDLVCSAGENPLTTIVEAVEKVSKYPGTKVLVLNAKTLSDINYFFSINGLSSTLGATNREKLKEQLGDICNVDKVLVASDDIRTSGAKVVPDDYVYATVLPDAENPMGYKEQPELGRTFVHQLQPAQTEGERPIICEVETYGNRELLTNDYTVKCNMGILEMNPGAKARINLTSAGLRSGKRVIITGGELVSNVSGSTVVTLNGGTASV